MTNSRDPGILQGRYRAAARRLRNTALKCDAPYTGQDTLKTEAKVLLKMLFNYQTRGGHSPEDMIVAVSTLTRKF